MRARQADAGCSDEYRVQPGDPCVPAGTEDTLGCPDLDARDVEVVGVDVYRLDGNDQDGWGCETGKVPSGGGGPDRIDVGAFAEPVGLTVTVVVGVVAAALLGQHYRGATEDSERRSIQVMILGTIAFGAVPVALGILRWA